MRAERLHWQALSSVIPEPTLVALVTDLGRRPRQRLCAVGCPSYEGRGMKALLYARQRAGPIAAFVTGFVGFLLVYVFVIAGSASAPELRASTQGLRGAAAANAIRHMSGVTHMSLGKGCGGTRSSSNRHIVVTRSGGALCATGGTMYAELLAMHTPPRRDHPTADRIVGDQAGDARYQAEYQNLRGLGAPKELAHQLASQVVKNQSASQP